MRLERENNNQTTSLKIPVSVLDDMVSETRDHLGHETAGLILGVRIQSSHGRILVPLKVFTPTDSSDIVRGRAVVQIGGETCALYQDWLGLAWENIVDNHKDNEKHPEVFSGKFGRLGTWHSHPNGSPEYSHIDSPQVDKRLLASPSDDFLFIISSVDPSVKPNQNNYIFTDTRGSVNFHFYYRNKNRINTTLLLKPNFVKNDVTNHLPAIPWFARNPSLYSSEIENLRNLGYRVTPIFISSLNEVEPPLVWFRCINERKDPQGNQPLYVGTDHNFDKSGLAFFTTVPPTDGLFRTNKKQEFKMKDWGVNNLSELVGIYSLFSKIN